MSKKNLISIIIAYHKKKKYFKETIKSILNQTYKNYELIIIYDDSCLKELQFIKSVLKDVKLKKVIINNKNCGAGISRNKGILISRGNYIAFCDADDTWKKNKLKVQLNFMMKNNLMISHSNYLVINDQSKIIGKFKTNNKLSYNDLLKSCDIGLSTVIVKKTILKKIRFSKLKTKEDYLLWLKIAQRTKFIYGIDQYLSCWRKSKNSLSSSITQKALDSYKLYRFYLKKNPIVSVLFFFRLTLYAMRKKLLIYWNNN